MNHKLFSVICDYKKQFILTTIVFFLGALMGLFLPENLRMKLFDMMLQKAHMMGSLTTGKIFLNNLSVSILAIMSGLLIVIPLFVIWVNGLVIGAIIRIVLSRLSFSVLLFSLLPHGIFEITAFIFSGSLGLIVGLKIIKQQAAQVPWLQFLTEISRFWALIIVPLLLIAAYLEVHVSSIYYKKHATAYTPLISNVLKKNAYRLLKYDSHTWKKQNRTVSVYQKTFSGNFFATNNGRRHEFFLINRKSRTYFQIKYNKIDKALLSDLMSLTDSGYYEMR